MYIVVYTIRQAVSGSKKVVKDTDKFETFESFEDARTRYENILQQDNLLTASITSVIKSTDYDTPEEVNECFKCNHLYVESEQAHPDYCPSCLTHQ